MDRCLEDVLLLLLEVPTAHGLLLYLLLGLVILVFPRSKNLLTELDLPKALLWVLFFEDLVQLDLILHLLADLSRDGLQDANKVLLLVIDVARDRPDELESGQKCWERFFNDLQLTLLNVLELALESREELDKILRNCLVLHELGKLIVIGTHVAGLLSLDTLHHVKNLLHLWHSQLLVEGVEGCGPRAPIFCLFRCTLGDAASAFGVLALNSLLDRLGPLVHCDDELVYQLLIVG